MFAKGFSLIEILVVLALMGLLLAIAIPSISSLSGVELRRAANELTSVVRDGYMRSAFSGTYSRLVLDMGKNQYWLESSTERVILSDGKEEEDNSESVSATRGGFKPVEGELGEKHDLPGKAKIVGFWSDQFDELQKTGEVYLYFFPEGYTQDAFIVISPKDSDKELVVTVSALTGDAIVETTRPEIPH